MATEDRTAAADEPACRAPSDHGSASMVPWTAVVSSRHGTVAHSGDCLRLRVEFVARSLADPPRMPRGGHRARRYRAAEPIDQPGHRAPHPRVHGAGPD